MFALNSANRYFLYPYFTDMRTSFYTLSGIVANQMGMNVQGGDAFIFANRRLKNLKVLYTEYGGLVIYNLKLERGTLSLPDQHTKMKPVRQKLPESLPRVMRHIYPEGYLGHEDEWTEIGTEETEHLEIIPAKAQVLVKAYHTFKRKDTGEILSPKAETEPIAKSYATASLLTEIIANKYAFHLPFYRQIEMFKSQCGIAIPQSTIEGWTDATCSTTTLSRTAFAPWRSGARDICSAATTARQRMRP